MESRVTASSTLRVPLTVVINPDVAILTTPPPVASEVAPVESNVETEVSPVTSKSAPITAFCTTDNPPSVCKEPLVVFEALVVSSIITLPEVVNCPIEEFPVEVIEPHPTVPKVAIFLLPFNTTALLAKAVPGVTPSKTPISAVVISVVSNVILVSQVIEPVTFKLSPS